MNDTFADEELTGRLRIEPKPGEPPAYRFHLDDLDALAGFVAAEANHATNKKRQKALEALFDRIHALLECYPNEEW